MSTRTPGGLAGNTAYDRLLVRPVKLLLPAILIALATTAVILLTVYAYVIITPESVRSPEGARDLATGFLPMSFFGIAVAATTGLIRYRDRYFGLPAAAGLGALAAGIEQLISRSFSPVVPEEGLLYLTIGVAAALAGCKAGSRELDRSMAGEKFLFNAVHDMARAKDADGVARATARALTTEESAIVALWTSAPGSDGLAQPTAIWAAPRADPSDTAGILETLSLQHLHDSDFRMLQMNHLGSEAAAHFKSLDIRSAFTLPLLSDGQERFGMMFVGIRRRRLSFGPASRRRIRSAAASAAITLEKHLTVAHNAALNARQSVADDLHDSLLQYMTGIAAQLDAATGKREQHQIMANLVRARELTTDAASSVRRVIDAAKPQTLDADCLTDSINDHIIAIRQDLSCTVEVRVQGEPRPISAQANHELLHIVKESLANIRKHSEASSASIDINYEPHAITLAVTDDGVGFDQRIPSDPPTSPQPPLVQPKNPQHYPVEGRSPKRRRSKTRP